MDISEYLIGLVFIGLGFLVGAFPDLLAGYNTMSEEEKVNVDREGLRKYARKSLILVGVVLIAAQYVLKSIGKMHIANYVLFPIILIGVMALILGAQKFDHNK
jgi:hypothetical protein